MKNIRHRLFLAFSLILILGAVLLSLSWFYIATSSAPDISADITKLEPADVGMVLGTSRKLKGNFLNPFFAYRISAAAALFHTGKVKYLIVSGNQADGGHEAGGYDEPTDMRNALIEAGVPENVIYRDYAGFRTLDSVLRAKEIFGQQRVIIVSQKFHLERALFLAKQHGLKDQGLEAAGVPFTLAAKTYFREMGARVLALGDVILDRHPRYSGKSVVLGQDPPT